MSEKWKDQQTEDLFDAILSLKNRAECYSLFEDLCTISEIKSLAQRLQIADLLYQGKTYAEIFEITGVSTATISRVNRCLEYGADGYRTVLMRRYGAEESDTNNNISEGE
jgi:TrpR-related protein YerC/YecD